MATKRKTTRRKKAAKGEGATAQDGSQLLTLSEVSRRTKISMPTLQKYKREQAQRIPSVGEGRRQRYPEEALQIFVELRDEGLSRRGRRKKGGATTSGKGRAASAPAAAGNESLLSLQQIGRATGISYPTLLRYSKLYLSRIPHVGTGKKRRYPPAAVDVFRELRRSSTRGRKPARPGLLATTGSVGGGDVERRLQRLEKAQGGLEERLKEIVSLLKKPMTVTLKR